VTYRVTARSLTPTPPAPVAEELSRPKRRCGPRVQSRSLTPGRARHLGAWPLPSNSRAKGALKHLAPRTSAAGRGWVGSPESRMTHCDTFSGSTLRAHARVCPITGKPVTMCHPSQPASSFVRAEPAHNGCGLKLDPDAPKSSAFSLPMFLKPSFTQLASKGFLASRFFAGFFAVLGPAPE
jgi:hypothetical protein